MPWTNNRKSCNAKRTGGKKKVEKKNIDRLERPSRNSGGLQKSAHIHCRIQPCRRQKKQIKKKQKKKKKQCKSHIGSRRRDCRSRRVGFRRRCLDFGNCTHLRGGRRQARRSRRRRILIRHRRSHRPHRLVGFERRREESTMLWGGASSVGDVADCGGGKNRVKVRGGGGTRFPATSAARDRASHSATTHCRAASAFAALRHARIFVSSSSRFISTYLRAWIDNEVSSSIVNKDKAA
jgi:hypothetical protein